MPRLAFLVLLASARENASCGASRRVRGFWPMVAVVTVVLLVALWWLVFAEAPANPNYLKDNHLPHIAAWASRISFSLGYTWDFWDQMIGAIGTNEYSGPAWLAIVWTMLAGDSSCRAWCWPAGVGRLQSPACWSCSWCCPWRHRRTTRRRST